MTENTEWQLARELMVLGGVTVPLYSSGLRMALPPERELSRAQTAYMFIWPGIFPGTRYRLTITMDPEGTDDDPAQPAQAADPQQPAPSGPPAEGPAGA